MSPPAMDIPMSPNPCMVLRPAARCLPSTVRALVSLILAVAFSRQAVSADDMDVEEDPLPPFASTVNFQVVFDQIPISGAIVVEKPGDGTLRALEGGRTYEIRINRLMLMQSV